ncbi:MAG TPA: hypothetical protein VEC38_02635 [Candidatus Binataceae bacterium]|nr:hypothetical protein [Candidatus Binataceae bacterium]
MRKREIWLPDKVDDMAQAQARSRGIDVSAFYSTLLSDHLLSDRPAESKAGSPVSLTSESSEANKQLASLPSEEREVQGRIIDPCDPDRPLDECDSGFFVKVGPGGGDYVMTQDFGDDPPFGISGLFEKVPDGQGDWSLQAGFSHTPGVPFDVSASFVGFPHRSISYAQRIVNEAIKIPGVIPSAYRQENGKNSGIAFKPNFLMIEALLQRKSGVRVSLYGEPDQFPSRPASLGRGRGSYSRIVVTNDEQLTGLLPLVRQAYELKLGPVPLLWGEKPGNLGSATSEKS